MKIRWTLRWQLGVYVATITICIIFSFYYSIAQRECFIAHQVLKGGGDVVLAPPSLRIDPRESEDLGMGICYGDFLEHSPQTIDLFLSGDRIRSLLIKGDASGGFLGTLKHCKYLDELRLDGLDFNEVDYFVLPPSLVHLDVLECESDDKILPKALSSLPNLAYLSISLDKENPNLLRAIFSIRSLQFLRIYKNPNRNFEIKTESFTTIDLPNLRRLILGCDFLSGDDESISLLLKRLPPTCSVER